MKQNFSRVSILGVAAVLAAPVYAQDAAAMQQASPPLDIALAQEAPAAESESNVIIVTAPRRRGGVETEVPPVVELDEADIAAVGAGSLDELIEQLAPQTGSARGRGGRPVVLVNGRRISGFREIRRYPPEAIEKIEVFPEEVALQFGYPADQRVINFILKDNFASREVESEFTVPTAGGRAAGEIELAQLTIDGPDRLSLSADYNTSSLLTEAERGILQTPGSTPTVSGDPDPANFRSLAADAETLEVEGTWNTGFGEGADAATLSVNASHSRAFTRSLSGLDTVLLTGPAGTALRTLDADPLTRRGKTISTALASSFNKPLGDWDIAATFDASLGDSVSTIDRRRDTALLVEAAAAGDLALDGDLGLVPSAGLDEARSKTYTVDSLATLSGRPILLPSGEVRVTLDAGYRLNGIDSEDSRSLGPETSLDRTRASAGVNVGIPLASAREGFLAPLGELNLDLGGGIDRLSDFGTLTDWNAGLNWRPSESLSLQASYTVREVAPTLTQLGEPQVLSFNVPVFDFTTGDTVLANIVSGGNPELLAETQRDIKLSASYDLDLFDRANFRVEYFRNRSDNVTEGFPLLTPEIEAAFPDRVQRDAGGSLVAIDRRPVTFAARGSSRVRYGFNVFGKIGKEQPETGESEPRAAEASPPGTAASREPRGFDPARMAELRQRYCGENAPASDPAQLPERMQERLKGPDGQIDPARVAEVRARICNPQAEGEQAGAPRGGRGRGGGMGGFGRGGEDRQGRWNLSLYHTIERENDALIAPGVPLLDLLDGDALGGGGVSRHRLELEGGLFHKGLGMRFSGNYAAGTRVDELNFGDLATFNVRFFANLEEQKWLTGGTPGFFKGTRISLGIDNILDAQQRVTDENGLVPLSYQPGLIDPLGRTVEVEFRKVF